MTEKEYRTPLNSTIPISMAENIRNISKNTGQRINFMVEKALEDFIAKHNMLAESNKPAEPEYDQNDKNTA